MFMVFALNAENQCHEVTLQRDTSYIYLYLKSNFLLCRLFFLSDHNLISNERNLITFL